MGFLEQNQRRYASPCTYPWIIKALRGQHHADQLIDQNKKYQKNSGPNFPKILIQSMVEHHHSQHASDNFCGHKYQFLAKT